MKSPTLLLVEDHEATREALRDVCEGAGFAVLEASNGQEALDKVEAGLAPDLVLLDLVMPVVDGWTVLRRLRARGAMPRVIVFTASGASEVAGFEQVAQVAFLPKPANVDDLVHLMAEMLGNGDVEGRRAPPADAA